MNNLDRLPLDAALAFAKQQYDELIAIRPLDRLVQGDRGTPAQAERVKKLLSDLFRISSRVRQVFRSRIANQDTTTLTLAESNAQFLRSTFLPNIGAIEQAYFADEPLLFELLGERQELPPLSGYRGIRDAIWFTAEYTNVMMDEDDERRHNIDTVFDLVDEPWFVPDQWDANLRALRPLILEIDEKQIPARIRMRLAEVHRSFTYGAWMATIALSRAVIEFALIERAPALGYSATQVDKQGREEFMNLNRLIASAASVRSELEGDLETLREAGNRILHPKRRQNVVPSPKILREEAFACVQAATRALELLYSKHRRQ